MNPLLAIAAVQSVSSLVANLTASAAQPVPRPFTSPQPSGPFASSGRETSRFDDVLGAQMGKSGSSSVALHFSEDVSQRMAERGIRLSEAQFQKLLQATEEAAAKGSRNALVLMEGLAFVVDLRSRAVVGMSDRADLDARLFTNIDSVVETKA